HHRPRACASRHRLPARDPHPRERRQSDRNGAGRRGGRRGRTRADAWIRAHAPMNEQRTANGAQLRERIDGYLRESGLGGRDARVVPLTGDASDRRYFRIIPDDGPSIVLALHAGPIDFASLPFASVGELLKQIPLPVPGVLGHSDELGIIALQDLGDVTLQAHLGAASPAEHAALYRPAVALV